MATKAKKEEQKTISLEPVKQTIIEADLSSLSDLILNKKCRSYERSEVWKQTHPKGSKMPKEFDQEYNLWEHLITSVTWDKPIEFHDDDYMLYTQEEWEMHMKENNPCILSAAFAGAMAEAFKTFGYKTSTGKDGTDLKRSLNFMSPKNPIEFSSVEYVQKLVPNNGMNKTNVVCAYNLFHNWKCKLKITCADIVFPYETIIDILATTGKFIGIGTQRKNGYGRFEIENIKVHEGLSI